MSGAIDRAEASSERLLAAHNRERLRLGAPALSWDSRLAGQARGWAERLAQSGRLAHESGGGSGDQTGENLWAGTASAFSPEEMVGYWVAERRDFTPGIFPAVSRSRNLNAVGHYTQMIWRGTSRVGCAIARGPNEDVLVCRYSAPGNVIGERVS